MYRKDVRVGIKEKREKVKSQAGREHLMFCWTLRRRRRKKSSIVHTVS